MMVQLGGGYARAGKDDTTLPMISKDYCGVPCPRIFIQFFYPEVLACIFRFLVQ